MGSGKLLALLPLALCLSAGYGPVSRAGKIDSNTRSASSKGGPVIQGMRTVIYHVPDIKKAKEWYGEILGVKPNFDQPFYVGFTVGGFELGLDPDMTGVTPGNNQIAYWGVQNADEALKYLLDHGASKQSDVKSVGEGPKGPVKVATVLDPFGNVFAVIENPYFNHEDVR